MSFERISVQEGKRIVDKDNAAVLDVRDRPSYDTAHIENAVHIDNSNITQFVDSTDKTRPLVIYCYHGNMSQGAANYFAEQGFSRVYSVDGGFEEWRHNL